MERSRSMPRRASHLRAADARTREVARLRRLLERAHSPRLHMVLIVSLTGAAGFLASATLRKFGIDALWLRYLLAVVLAYGAFLVLLWVWLYVRRDDLLDASDALDIVDVPGGPAPNAVATLPPEPGSEGFGGGAFGGGGAGGSFDDAGAPVGDAPPSYAADPAGAGVSDGPTGAASGVFDLDDLAFVLVAVAALAGALWAALWLVWGAPLLLAEVLFDAALAAGLYRRLRDVRGEHWLRTALRRTAAPFAALAILLALSGAVLQDLAPEAGSIGEVFELLSRDR